MKTPDQMLAPVELETLHRETVRRFLLVFSRFEAALKHAGHSTQRQSYLKMDWREFVEGNRQGMEWQSIRSAELRPLLDGPPAEQREAGGELLFAEEARRQPDQADPLWVLEVVYRVRNNLFHGGKWPAQPERDAALLRACLVALGFYVDLSRRVSDSYFGL